MSSFFDYIGADMTVEGGGAKSLGVIERLEKLLNAGATHPPMTPDELRALIAVAKAARDMSHEHHCAMSIAESTWREVYGDSGLRERTCTCRKQFVDAALAALEEGGRR